MNRCFAGVAKITGLVVVTRDQLWSHDVSRISTPIVPGATVFLHLGFPPPGKVVFTRPDMEL